MDCPVLSIDVSKSKSYAAAFLSLKKPYQKPFSFSHNPNNMSSLINCLTDMESVSGLKPQVVLEATGNYSKPLVSFFMDHGYEVVVLNPIETHFLKKKAIRKVKTDPVDAIRIAQVFYQSTYKPISILPSNIMDLRNLCRQFDGFNCLYTETQLRFRCILDLIFPNYDKVFSKVSGVTALNVISSFPSPKAVLSASKDELLHALKPARQSRPWYEMKVEQLLMAARESLPCNQAQQSNIRVLKDYVNVLLTLQKVMTGIRAQLIAQAKLSPIFHLILSIPGVGELTAATILSEIGDIHRFPTVKQLVAFAGLDPSVFESGKFKATNNKISKRVLLI